MLDGAFTSPKIRMLGVLLEIPWLHAVGLCGALWRFTGKHAPTGEIGLHSNEEIAIALEWTGDPQSLVEAFVRSRLLDRVDGPERLLVHDWPDHSPRHVRAALQRKGLDFSPRYIAQNIAQTTDTTTVCATVRATDSTIGGATVPSTSSSSSSHASTPTSTFPNTHTVDDLVESVWEAYVPGKKQGKQPGLEAIKASIRSMVGEGRSPRDAAEFMRARTAEFTSNALAKVAGGETEIRYIPQAVTYFRQERWKDDDTEPTREQVRNLTIDHEIATARAAMDEELEAPPRTLPRLESNA
jgi:hypothetical protein